jgi:hypothetical protein
MLLTVAICTWNRSALLRATLERLTQIVVPAGVDWELLVVDNRSPDDTADVIAAFEDRLPLRPLMEPALGLSNARNCALAAARGAYVIWTDDDVLVDSNWLVAYAAAFRRYPTATFFGGPVDPWFDGTPPNWLAAVMPLVSPAFAVKDLGPAERPLDAVTLPHGANMACATGPQRQYRYDAALGRRGQAMMGAEETAHFQAMLADGHTGRWVPDARVQHFIPAARQTTAYLRRYYAGNGATDPIVHGVRADMRLLFGRPRWAWREAITQEAAYRLTRPLATPSVWIDHLKRASYAWGVLSATRPI